MAIHSISNNRTTTLNAQTAGDTWIVEKTGSIVTSGTVAIEAGGPAAGREIKVLGLVHSDDVGISFGAMNGKGGGVLTIGKSGSVEGDNFYAIVTRGNDHETTNNGTVSGMTGLGAFGNRNDIVNNGTITGLDTAVEIDTRNQSIVNTGTLDGGDVGIGGNGTGKATWTISIDNSGDISGAKHAIQLLTGSAVHIVNSGAIDGNVETGGGDDLFDNRGGSITSYVNLGDGNDTYVIDAGAVAITEDMGMGTDTVRSTVTHALGANLERLVLIGNADRNGSGNELDNRLTGNGGDNRLDGVAGIDRLDGGLGNDRLFGGIDADTFVFATGSGHDVIGDFENGIDQIDLSGWAAITGLADLKNNHLTVSADGHDLYITAGADRLILKDTDATELSVGDFLFA